MPKETKEVSESVIKRMSFYSQILEKLKTKDVEFISIQQLEEKFGLNVIRFRKDLACFGEFNMQELVMNQWEVDKLLSKLKKILGLNKKQKAILIGGGRIGTALTDFNQKEKNSEVKIKSVFDNDPEKIGTKIGELEIKPVSKVPQVVKEINPEIGIITVSNQTAQQVADLLIENGIKVLLNFASIHVEVPEEVYLQNIDLTLEMRKLMYYSNS
ncbi:redox-sensing transcriptional repressor Rex [Acetohalobium arabaticum]|uniref:Redox-sensing transcriptional repressor Rex n=1 Tax=Acetohalobium arabaticum (strain ATCC 49924 / DSM 5501 / Z-7288) TaxID=574087 RepID=D9QRU0_ACEAZ|nr:redox-sensing transcriptional repressor Rex [Acetohalobium arabaticum]ADL13231.1 CoA-binding domain protein [Acetohalobium arabaticum DSM 5501]